MVVEWGGYLREGGKRGENAGEREREGGFGSGRIELERVGLNAVKVVRWRLAVALDEIKAHIYIYII